MHEIQLNVSQKRIAFYTILVRTEKMQVAILHWLPGEKRAVVGLQQVANDRLQFGSAWYFHSVHNFRHFTAKR
jgi:hypothetical protein